MKWLTFDGKWAPGSRSQFNQMQDGLTKDITDQVYYYVLFGGRFEDKITLANMLRFRAKDNEVFLSVDIQKVSPILRLVAEGLKS